MKELGRRGKERKEAKEEIKDKGVRGKRKEQKAWSRDKKKLENRVSPSIKSLAEYSKGPIKYWVIRCQGVPIWSYI